MGKKSTSGSKSTTGSKDTTDTTVTVQSESPPTPAPKAVDAPPPPPSDMTPDSIGKFFRHGTHPTPTSFPSLPTYVTNTRIILGTLYGLYLGAMGAKTTTPMFVGFGLVFTLPSVFLERWSKMDGEVWGGDLIVNGVVQGVAMMLLCWIWIYTYKVEGGEAMQQLIAGSVLAYQKHKDGIVEEVLVAEGGAGEVGGESAVGEVVGGSVGDEF